MRRLLLWFFFLAPLPLYAANTYYVSCPARGTGDCLTAANACTPATVWTKPFTGSDDVVNFVGTDETSLTNGHYTGACMLGPPDGYIYATAINDGLGTMTAGYHTFVYTETVGGVESNATTLIPVTVNFAATNRVLLDNVLRTYKVGASPRRTIYGTKAGGSTFFKLPTSCNDAFNNATTTSTTCSPGIDSTWINVQPPTGSYPPNQNGSAGHPTVLQAVNPGGVFIDGGSNNRPATFRAVEYMTIDGFDIANAGPGDDAVVNIFNSHHITVQNTIAANALPKYNSSVFTMWSNGGRNAPYLHDVTLDKVAGIGYGRKVFHSFQNNGPVTIKNSVGVWMGSQHTGPKETFSTVYWNSNETLLDSYLFWTGELTPQTSFVYSNNLCYNVGTGNTCAQPCPGTCNGTQMTNWGINNANYEAGPDNVGTGAEAKLSLKMFGTIQIYRSTDFAGGNNQYGFLNTNSGGTTLKDHVIGFASGGPTHGAAYSTMQDFALYGCSTCPAPKDMFGINLTAIRPTPMVPTPALHADWVITPIARLSNNSTFTYDGSSGLSKANICTLHNDDGTLSATKRFPWPMQARMNAFAGLLGLTAINVQNEVTAMFGAIPAACDNGGATPTNTPTFTQTSTMTFTPSQSPTPTFTPTPTQTFTRTPTVTGTLGPVTGTCTYWHPATNTSPGYFMDEPCGLGWSHVHATPVPQ